METKTKKLTLAFVDEFVAAMQKAGCESEEVSPRLLPDYRRKDM